MKKRLLSMLVLLMTVVTGAWAQETLLVTMTAGGTVTYDPATATDVAEITMMGATQLGTWEDYNGGNHYSWLNSSWNDTDKGTLEVTAKPGYTITKVVFSGLDIAGSPGSREVTASPFAVYPWGSGSAFGSAVYTSDSYTEIFRNAASNDIMGIEKIEVYGYAGTPAPDVDGEFTLSVGTSEHGTVTFKVGENTVTTAKEGQTVTVEITPATGWVVGTVTGQWYAAIAAAPRRTGIDLLNAVTLTPVEGAENTYTFTMQRANAEFSATYKKVIQDAWIQDIAAVTYSSEALTPAVTVKDGETELVQGTDYTVSYADNTNAGTATVNITGIGDYTGTVTKTFTINKAKGSVWFYSPWYDATYGDPDFAIEAGFSGGGTLTYSSNNKSVATVDANTGVLTIKGVGKTIITASLANSSNYTSGNDYYELTVKPKDIEYEGGDITQDENGYTVALTEDADNPNAQPLPSDADLYNLSYSRTLTAPGTGEGDKTIDGQAANLFTVCLPFAPKTDDAAKYYTLSGVSGETLLFDEVTTPAANTPYLVAVTGSVNFLEDCADLNVASMEIATTTKDGYTFSGTFTGLTNTQAAGKYILQKGNKWGKVTAEKQNAYIPPFRAFVEAPATAAPELNGHIEGNATGIQNIRTVDLDGTEHWYDLSGKRIAAPTKGINILNGKKVVIK